MLLHDVIATRPIWHSAIIKEYIDAELLLISICRVLVLLRFGGFPVHRLCWALRAMQQLVALTRQYLPS
jgi:hypothetical protein